MKIYFYLFVICGLYGPVNYLINSLPPAVEVCEVSEMTASAVKAPKVKAKPKRAKAPAVKETLQSSLTRAIWTEMDNSTTTDEAQYIAETVLFKYFEYTKGSMTLHQYLKKYPAHFAGYKSKSVAEFRAYKAGTLQKFKGKRIKDYDAIRPKIDAYYAGWVAKWERAETAALVRLEQQDEEYFMRIKNYHHTNVPDTSKLNMRHIRAVRADEDLDLLDTDTQHDFYAYNKPILWFDDYKDWRKNLLQ